MTDERTEKLSDATHEADRRDAQAEHGAPQVPTPEEEAAAESNTVSDATREGYKEMLERGANQKGEGRI
jgi:hypothetical protein